MGSWHCRYETSSSPYGSNVSSHSSQNMTICGFSTDSPTQHGKLLKSGIKEIFPIDTLGLSPQNQQSLLIELIFSCFPGLFQLQDGGEKAFSKRNAKNARRLGRDAATAPFPKSRASYFPSARFNTSPLYSDYTIIESLFSTIPYSHNAKA